VPSLAIAALLLACGLAGLGGCRGSQAAGPALFFDKAWQASAQEKGTVWFFPAVDEADAWDESRVDRVRCPAVVPQYWCAPVEVWSTDPQHPSSYGGGVAGPFGIGITTRLPERLVPLRVRNQSSAGMGIGEDCPNEDRMFPVHPESFTVVVVDSRAYKVEIGGRRYCPSTSIVGVVSHAPGREAAQRAIALAGAGGTDAALRVAALEALARSPDNDRCPEVQALVRRIQEGDPSRRVRDYAKERWPRDRLERAQVSGGACWP
jgi:hypothetical protein